MRVEHRALPVDSVDTSVAEGVREGHEESVVEHYAERMQSGDQFPPIEVIAEKVGDDEEFWCWDGSYRCRAARRNGEETIQARCITGTKNDAVWASYSSNTRHGVRRSRKTIQMVVRKCLEDPRSQKLPNPELSRHLGVSKELIRQVKEELGVPQHPPGRMSKQPKPPAPPEREKEHPEDEDSAEVAGSPPDLRKPAYLDSVGGSIPAKMHDVFAKRSQVQSVKNLASKLKSRILDLCEDPDFAPHLHRQTLQTAMEDVFTALKYAEPYAVCPYCRGNGNCQPCRDTGWVGQPLYRQSGENG